MAFKRWGCEFDGPWPNTDLLKPRSGLWVIWRKNGQQWEVIDVGESRNVRQSVLGKTATLEEGLSPQESIHYSASYPPNLTDAARKELADHILKVARPC